MKVQLAINAADKRILRFSTCKGSEHDFRLFKESGLKLDGRVLILADSGYQGIAAVHKNSATPVKSSKKRRLGAAEKNYNREISKRRIYIEHVNRHLKIFRILSSRYRNKRKDFRLRVSLVCGIYNFQL